MDTVTIRPRWYCWPSLGGLAAIACCVVLGFFNHGLFGVAPILIAGWLWAVAGTKIEVTPTVVVQKSWLLLRLEAPRDAITAIHWYGQYFTLTGADNQLLQKLPSLGWRRGQLLDLSEALGARLYSHRTKWGLGRDRTVGHRLRRDNAGQGPAHINRV